MVAVLDQSFWNKISNISSSVSMKPEDLLAVMYYESGLNPVAHNKNGDASGLIQFMPETLDNVGFKGNPQDFRALSANQQLDYVARYIQDKAHLNGGSFKSAAQYYVANFWPIALQLPGVQKEDPSTVIVEENPTSQKYPGVSLSFERAAYKANTVLDVDKDGKITYGDIEKVMNGVKQSRGYQNAVATLESGNDLTVGKGSISPLSPPKETYDKLDQIEESLNSLLKAVGYSTPSSHFLLKRSFKDNLLPTNILIRVSSSDPLASIEFARILSIALDEELFSDSLIYVDEEKGAEVLSTIHGGGKHQTIDAVAELCNHLSSYFEKATYKIGGYKVFTSIRPNTFPTYQELSIRAAQTYFNNFHLRF